MKHRRRGALATISTVVVALVAAAPGVAAPSKVKIRNSSSPAASRTPTVGTVSGSTSIPFQINLALSDPQGSAAFAQAVSTPGNAQYGKYLTAAQWEARYAPTAASVSKVTAFLKNNGFSVGSVPDDRLFIPATGTAAQIEKVFSTSLAIHNVAGRRLRLADESLQVPSDIVGVISGVSGVSQTVMKPTATTDAPSTAPASTSASTVPPGFRVATPCNDYYNQSVDTLLPAYGHGFPGEPPWAVCGYIPAQLRVAYGLTTASNGAGQKVAVVDPYLSPTLFTDAQRYAAEEDPGHNLTSKNYILSSSKTFDDQQLCDSLGWYGEQTLDVEAVHATAPGATIVVAAASDCEDGLISTLNGLIQNHSADVISNSYGDPAGDGLDPAGYRATYDDMLQMAAAEGISVLFSSGDWEDNYTLTGVTSPTFPASDPYATGIGGTTLAIGSESQRLNEWGWSTVRSFYCNAAYEAAGGCTAGQRGKWLPIDLTLDGGSGGGTSSVYSQPSYQKGIVPTSLSEAGGATTPMRVEPDISMEADPATGFLVGETQSFPEGNSYDTYRIGGTSLSSPLMAGVIARANQTGGKAVGFINPAVYSLASNSSAILDVLPANKVIQSRADFINSVDDTDGYYYTTRRVGYEGKEVYCASSAASSCSTQEMALHVTRGYDNMTGIGAPNSGFVAALVAKAH